MEHSRRINEEGLAIMNSLLDDQLDLLKKQGCEHKKAPSFGVTNFGDQN